MKYHAILAQAYGTGDYGGCTYNENTTQCTTGAGSGSNSTGSGNSGSLSDTGISLVFIISIACLLIFAGLVIRLWRRKPLAVQEVEELDDKRFVNRF